MRPQIILLVTLLFFFFSCSKNNHQQVSTNTNNVCGSYTKYTPIFIPADTITSPIPIDSFPLALGNQWTYQVVELASDACGGIYQDTFKYVMTVIDQTNINGLRFATIYNDYQQYASSFDASIHFSSTFFCYPQSKYYYVNLNNGLHQLSSLASTDSSYIADSSGFIINTDSVAYLWNSREYAAAGDTTAKRQWMNYISVTTPAGIFNCRKQSVTAQLCSAYQYFSSKGLVLEIQGSSGPSMGPGTGPTYMTRIITLVAVNF